MKGSKRCPIWASSLFFISWRLFPARPLSHPLYSCSPFTHVCNLDGKHTSGNYIQTRICLASKSLLFPLLQAIFPSFLLQRPKKEVSRRKGTRTVGKDRECFFFDLCPEIFWCFLPSTKAAVPYFMGINLLVLCV